MRDFLGPLVLGVGRGGGQQKVDWTIMCKRELEGKIPMQKPTEIAEVVSQVGR